MRRLVSARVRTGGPARRRRGESGTQPPRRRRRRATVRPGWLTVPFLSPSMNRWRHASPQNRCTPSIRPLPHASHLVHRCLPSVCAETLRASPAPPGLLLSSVVAPVAVPACDQYVVADLRSPIGPRANTHVPRQPVPSSRPRAGLWLTRAAATSLPACRPRRRSAAPRRDRSGGAARSSARDPQHLLPLGQPAHCARDGEHHGEHFRREAHGLVDDAGVEVHVGIELALDEVLVLERDPLQFQRDVQLGGCARSPRTPRRPSA